MSCTMTPLAQRLTHQGSNFAPLPDALVAQGEPAQQHDLTEIPQCQPVALPAEHHECDDVTRQRCTIEHAVTAQGTC
jgi:hypothetical protein